MLMKVVRCIDNHLNEFINRVELVEAETFFEFSVVRKDQLSHYGIWRTGRIRTVSWWDSYYASSEQVPYIRRASSLMKRGSSSFASHSASAAIAPSIAASGSNSDFA